MSCCPNASSPGTQKGPSTLPFNVEYGTPNNPTQAVCNNNMCLLPNGPIIPTRPMFPSALPSDFTPSSTNVQTNYLNVKKLGCICNLRASCLQVDDGARNTGTTTVVFKNLPEINGEYSFLVADSQGKVHTLESTLVSKQTKSKSQVSVRQPSFGDYDGEDDYPGMPSYQAQANYSAPPVAAVPSPNNMIPQNPYNYNSCQKGNCGNLGGC